jgi:hypothetical protein
VQLRVLRDYSACPPQLFDAAADPPVMRFICEHYGMIGTCPSVATVAPLTGISTTVTGKAAGSATITATDATAHASASVALTVAPDPLAPWLGVWVGSVHSECLYSGPIMLVISRNDQYVPNLILAQYRDTVGRPLSADQFLVSGNSAKEYYHAPDTLTLSGNTLTIVNDVQPGGPSCEYQTGSFARQ